MPGYYSFWEFEYPTSLDRWVFGRIEIIGEGWFGHFWRLEIDGYSEEIEVIKTNWELGHVQMEAWGDGGVNDIDIHYKFLRHRHRHGGEAYWRLWHEDTSVLREDDAYRIWFVDGREYEVMGVG